MIHQKVPKLYFQSQFYMSKIKLFFSKKKKKSFNNVTLADHFLFFLDSILEPLYFVKSCPIFDELALPVFSKYSGFL